MEKQNNQSELLLVQLLKQFNIPSLGYTPEDVSEIIAIKAFHLQKVEEEEDTLFTKWYKELIDKKLLSSGEDYLNNLIQYPILSWLEENKLSVFSKYNIPTINFNPYVGFIRILSLKQEELENGKSKLIFYLDKKLDSKRSQDSFYNWLVNNSFERLIGNLNRVESLTYKDELLSLTLLPKRVLKPKKAQITQTNSQARKVIVTR